MSEYSNYVESRLSATPLTGAELLAGSQGGNARKWTVAMIKAFTLAGFVIPDGVYGDVTVSGGGTVWTVTTGGSGVTDGDKVGVQVSAGATIWLPSDHAAAIVATAGGTITLPWSSKERGFFAGDDAIDEDKIVTLVPGTRATEGDFIFEVSVADITLDFGDNTRSTHANFVDGVFTAQDVGLYKVHATRYGPGGTLWLLDFNGVYSVGDAPPEPPDPSEWVLGTGIWDDSAYWKDDAIWKD